MTLSVNPKFPLKVKNFYELMGVNIGNSAGYSALFHKLRPAGYLINISVITIYISSLPKIFICVH